MADGGDGHAAEAARLNALISYAVLDIEPDPAFDDLAQLAAMVLGVPTATITLVDERREWTLAAFGAARTSTARAGGLCQDVVATGSAVIVRDLWADPRFAAAPVVTGSAALGFLAAVPLVDRDGYVLGALCAMDTIPRDDAAGRIDVLSGMARQVVAQLELRRVTDLADQRAQEIVRGDERYQALVEHSGAAITVVAADSGEYLYANAAAAEMRHVADGAQLLGDSTAAHLSLEQRGRFDHWLADVVANGRVAQTSVAGEMLTGPDGPRLIDVEASAVSWAGRRAVRVEVRDVTARVAQELRMAEGEAKAWRLLHAAPDPVVVVDADGLIELVNAQAVRLFGYQPHELIGLPLETLVPAGRRDEHRRLRAAYSATEQPNPMCTGPNVVGVRKDGSTVAVEVNLSAITLSTGRAVLASVREVSEARAWRRRLEASEARARQMLLAAPDAVVVTDADGRIEEINTAAARLFGYQPDELVGLPVETLLPAALRDVHRAAHTATEQPRPMSTGPNVVALCKDGTTVAVEVNLSAIDLSSGRAILASVRDVSESRQLQRELAAARDRFRDILNGATEQAIIATDPHGRITVANEGAQRMTGYTQAQLLARTPVLLHDHDEIIARAGELGIPAGFEVLVAPAREGAAETREWTYRTASGAALTVALTVTSTFGPSGELTGYILVANDVTARKRAEDQLRVSEERFRLAFDDAPIGMTLSSRSAGTAGQFLRVNRAMCELTGRSESDLLGRSLGDLVHAQDREHIERLVGLHVRGEVEHADFEVRCPHPSGREMWVYLASSLVHRADGDPLYAITQWQDITHRKQTETLLEERFRELAGSVDAGFALRQIDPPEFLYVNPAYLTMFGFDPAGPQPTPAQALSLVHPDDLFRVGTILGAPHGSERVEQEWRFIRPSGEQRWVLGRISPIVDGDGQIRRVAGVFEDITERRAAQDAVLAARADAERANTAKDEFLSRISHESRTSLNAVLGFAQLLELDTRDESQEEAVGHILRGGRHLLAMIEDLLDITGIDAGQPELSLESVRVAELLDDTIGRMQLLAATNGIALRFDRAQPAAARDLLADRRRLTQVLLNLLSNAIKYNRPGGHVDIAVAPTGDASLAIAFSDTGMGIAAADIPRLFIPFDRLGRQSSDVAGTGLGLLLSRRLITLMNGRLDVESNPGHGSTFTVTVPLTVAPEAPAPTPIGHREPAIDTTPATLLYIEDNRSNVELVTSVLLGRPGWTMLHAATGAAGLELARNTIPSVILLDLHLPDIDGIDVLHTLKANPDTADIPIAILSADASPTQVGRLLTAGAQLYLTKPLDLSELLAFLDSHAG